MNCPTLDHYRRHADLYGTELIVQTADLDEKDLGELRSYCRHLERTKRWSRTGWVERAIVRATCEECGLDLPANASSRMRRHAHCRVKACRTRKASGTPAKRYTDGESGAVGADYGQVAA
jgi:hypothetical protein